MTIAVSFGDPGLPERFWSKVSPCPMSGCWIWTAALVRGYGITWIDGKRIYAHRATYSVLVAPIPDGLVIDHRVCKFPPCCNPMHLEPVLQRENCRRGNAKYNGAEQRARTHCPKGHPYDATNTYITRRGNRNCRECGRIAVRIGRARGTHA